MAFVGSKICLISKSEIRYIGTLHSINQEESTVALEKVQSFGSEGRRGNPQEEIPPSDQVFPFILFKGTDIKDLQVITAPQPQIPNDPAILGTQPIQHPPFGGFMSHGMNQMPPGMNPYMMPSYQQQLWQPTNQFMPIVDTREKPMETMRVELKEPKPMDSMRQIEQRNDRDDQRMDRRFEPKEHLFDRENRIEQREQRHDQRHEPRHDQREQPHKEQKEQRHDQCRRAQREQRENPRREQRHDQHHDRNEELSNKLDQMNLNDAKPSLEPHPKTKEVMRQDNNEFRGRGRGRRGRGGFKGNPVPKNDFDFESSNAKFDALKDSVEDPKNESFYEKSSFFDNISCDAKDRQLGSDGRVGRQEERKLNIETFGQAGSRGRGYYRGRGRGRGRGRFRGQSTGIVVQNS